MIKIEEKLIKNLEVKRGEEERVKMTEGLSAGTPVEVRFLPESREFNEKWYTECNAIDVKPIA